MSNPNNIIRPPVLNVNQPPSQQTTSETPDPNATPELRSLIASIATQVLSSQAKNLVQAYLNPNAEFASASDQTIDAQYRNNLSDLDKIPDVVRCLREFSGNPGEFSSWKKSVERILQIYEPIKGTPKYYGILSVIRNKIIGNADIALESYNTPLDWKAICRCLTIHYADKRDLGTLEYQLTSLIQGKATIQEFYQQIYSHLSLILNKISCMEISTESMRLLTETYRDKALDTFIRGLNGDLPRLLGMKEPVDLPQALHFCLKLENQNFRANYANNYHGNNRRFPHNPPPIPPKRSHHPQFNRQAPFYPQLAHFPQPAIRPQQYFAPQKPYYNNGQQFSQLPPRPNAPKPQPRPEPMDIDRSIQTNLVNYANRPQPPKYAEKRPPFNPAIHRSAPPPKFQRNYHINAEIPNYQFPQEQVPNWLPQEQTGNYQSLREQVDDTLAYQQAQQQADSENNYGETLSEYSEQFFGNARNSEHQTSDLADIHFLG